MHRRYSTIVFSIALMVFLGACRTADAPSTAATQPTHTVAVPPATAAMSPEPTNAPAMPADPATPDASDETTDLSDNADDGSNSLSSLMALPEIGELLPTATPLSDADVVPVRELGVGEAGRHVNLTYGYDLRYPLEWFTGFGIRPVLVSFSNLDPGTTNRDGMRSSGCLIEIATSANTFNFNLDGFQAQSPQTYEGAQQTELGGVPALLVGREIEGQPFNSEFLQVIAQDHVFLITFEYAPEQETVCRPAFEEMLASWSWFEPDLIPYKNQIYGYSVRHPRRWFPHSSTEQGVFVSSIDPSTVTSVDELAQQGMVVHTHVYENSELLPLKQFLVSSIGDLGLTSDVDLSDILGVKSIKAGPAGLEVMTGYFQGPLGRVYAVDTYYPADRRREFRPIANAIIYSFDF